MPRELPSYRNNLERLDEKFPNSETLTRAELIELTGKDRKTVNKMFPFEGKYISKANLARWLARLGAIE